MWSHKSCLRFLWAGCWLLAKAGIAATPVVIAHAGGALLAPENTLAALAIAARTAEVVEFDVQVSSDGELVVIHDATVDRTTDGIGKVSELPLASLKTLDAGSWFSPAFADERIPTLTEALVAIGPVTIPLIDRKAGSAETFDRVLRASGADTRAMVQSTDSAFLNALHALNPSVTLGFVGQGSLTSNALADGSSQGVQILSWYKDDVTPALIAAVHAFGMKVYAWTVNGPALQDFIDLGVDGIISDDPGLLRDLADASPSSQDRLGEDLVSYWTMDDGLTNSQARVAADTEARNPGMLAGFSSSSPGWATAAPASSDGILILDGAAQCVTLPRSRSLDIGTNALSLSVWVRLPQRPSQLSQSYGSIYDSVQDSYVLYLDRARAELCFKITDATGRSARPGIPEKYLQTNVWHHVLGVYDGGAGPVAGQARLYLDGRLMDVHTGDDAESGRGLIAVVKPGQAAAIGRNGTESRFGMACAVNDLAVWRRPVRAGEVRQIVDPVDEGEPLEKQLMIVHLTGARFPAAAGATELECFVTHGDVPAGNVYLMSAEQAGGPYVEESEATVENLGNGRFRVAAATSGPARRFYRIGIRQ